MIKICWYPARCISKIKQSHYARECVSCVCAYVCVFQLKHFEENWHVPNHIEYNVLMFFYLMLTSLNVLCWTCIYRLDCLWTVWKLQIKRQKFRCGDLCLNRVKINILNFSKKVMVTCKKICVVWQIYMV